MAIHLASKYGKLVQKLVLASAASRQYPSSHKLFEMWERICDKYDVKSLNQSFFEYVYSEEYFDKYKDVFRFLENIGSSEDCIRFKILCEAINSFDEYDLLEKISCPTLVTASKKDNVFPVAAAEDIAKKMNCKLFIYDGYGHAVYDEAPDFKERLFDFFEE